MREIGTKPFAIANREAAEKELCELIVELTVENNPFDVDVYAYIDDDGNVSFSEFSNPGGNSWLNDDHYVVYKDGQHEGVLCEVFESVRELADVLGLSVLELFNQAKESGYVDEDADVADAEEYMYDISKYIKQFIDFKDKFMSAVKDYAGDNYFEELASTSLDNMISEINEHYIVVTEKEFAAITKVYDILGFDIDSAANDYRYDYLTINTARNGRDVCWYLDSENRTAVVYIDTLDELSKEEIERELL